MGQPQFFLQEIPLNFIYIKTLKIYTRGCYEYLVRSREIGIQQQFPDGLTVDSKCISKPGINKIGKPGLLEWQCNMPPPHDRDPKDPCCNTKYPCIFTVMGMNNIRSDMFKKLICFYKICRMIVKVKEVKFTKRYRSFSNVCKI